VQVKLVRSGGFAGLDMVATVDTVDLSTDQQDLVATLLTGDLPGPGPGRSGRSGGADQFSYQLEIQHGDRMVRRHWEEPEVPETVRPLLATLTRQAKPAR
jgi:hypothetical protein